jgi:glycosyltransferase involved in cell wall biosynthesis
LKILELYKNCDIVSFPSLAEGFGIIIIEAQKTGRCILSSNINIIREVGGNGYLSVDPYNIEDIRNGFLKIINDAPLRKRIINDGLNNVKRFTYEIFINSYKELYENLG